MPSRHTQATLVFTPTWNIIFPIFKSLPHRHFLLFRFWGLATGLLSEICVM